MRLGRAFSLVPGSEWISRLWIVRSLLGRLMANRGSAIGPDEMSEFILDTRACAALDDLVEGMDADEPPIFADVDVRTRVAWGKSDRTLPWKSYGEPFCDGLPGVERLMLEGVGHVPMYDDPALVAKTILDVTTVR